LKGWKPEDGGLGPVVDESVLAERFSATIRSSLLRRQEKETPSPFVIHRSSPES
jgi:hypothetical protein